MTDLEQQVWAVAFANFFCREVAFYDKYGGGTIDDVSGFSCAERADVAVMKLREAIRDDDTSYLLVNGYRATAPENGDDRS